MWKYLSKLDGPNPKSFSQGHEWTFFVEMGEVHSFFPNVITNKAILNEWRAASLWFLLFMVVEFDQFPIYVFIWVFWNSWAFIACLTGYLIMEGQQ